MELKEVLKIMDDIINDSTVPRNIRKAVSDAKALVEKKEGDPVVNISEAIYILDEASNDVNIPMHTRTQLWMVIGELERIKEEIKEKESK